MAAATMFTNLKITISHQPFERSGRKFTRKRISGLLTLSILKIDFKNTATQRTSMALAQVSDISTSASM